MKVVTGHVIPSCTMIHVRPNIHIFNPSDHDAYVEVTDSGEVRVKALPFGRLIISYADLEGK